MTLTTKALSAAKDTSFWLSPRRLLIGAAIFHLVVTITIFGLAHHGALPGTFDTNGIAVSFAPDGIGFREEAAKLGDDLARDPVRNWLIATSPFHVKLYSLGFALLGPWLGYTILCAEPLNALCYVAILVLIFNLGQEAFNRRAGLIGAATVALWPSFLLHTTQLLKDPLFLVGMLAFILVNLRLLSRSFSWAKALLTGAGGGLIAFFVWIARDSMGELLIATVVLGAAMLIVRQFREKQSQAANLIGMALMLVVTVGVTRVVPEFHKPDATQGTIETITQSNVYPEGVRTTAFERQETPSLNPWSRIVARAGKVRQKFVIEYPDASSNIDSNVQLTSMADLIRYLPRAAAVGFFAPFPNMWLETGNKVGSAGRLLSGMEGMAMYLIEGLAIVGLWRGRRRFSVWFLWLVAAMGIISLGLVVVNVGALYRLRYIFLLLLIILATGGAAQTFDWFRKKPVGLS